MADASVDGMTLASAVVLIVPSRIREGHGVDVEIKQMPAQRVGTVKHVGPYNRISEAFGKLGQIAGRAGLFGRPGASMIALYYDDPDSTPADRLHSEAGVTVPDDVALPAGLEDHRLAAGRYAKTLHVGAYDTLGETWARFRGGWLPASGERLGDGPSYERYLNDPSTTPKDQLRTEIYLPIAD